MVYVAAAAIGYLLGSLPVALTVGRRYGVDLLTAGDGNPGAWNALELLGARRAWPVFTGDGLKAAAAGLAGLVLAGWWGAWAGVAGAMAGHALPAFSRLRGGKSVMCFVGGSFVLSPAAAVISLAVGAAVAAASSFAWGVRAGVFGLPLVQLVTEPIQRVAATGVLMTMIGVLFAVDRLRRR